MPVAGVRPSSGDITAALDRLPLPSFCLDADGMVTWLNDAAKDVVGDLTGRSFLTPVAPESEHVVKDAYARKLVGDAGLTTYEAVLLQRDGTRVVVELSSTPLEDDGHVVGVFGFFIPEKVLPAVASPHLTPRQAEVLRQLAAGCSTHQIAVQLGVSVDTVRNHIRDLMKRLGVHSRLEAVIAARERGLL